MTKVTTRPEIDLTVVTEECHFEVGMGRTTERIIEEDCNRLTVIEMTLGEENLRGHKTIEVRIIEVDVETIIETITEMIILEEAEVGLEKDNIQVMLEGMTEAVVDQDQVQEPVQIETELDVINVENMTNLLITVLTQTQKGK